MDQEQQNAPSRRARPAVFGGLGGLLLIAAWLGMSAVKDYRWAGSWSRNMVSDGWSVAATSDNAVALTHPWSIVHPPITLIWFMKPDEAIEVASGIYVIPEVRVRYDYDRTETDELLAVYDVHRNQSTAVSTDRNLEGLDLSSLKWYTPELDTPGEHLMQFVAREAARSER